jgi:ABC-type multidrug transport system ATPase subunit
MIILEMDKIAKSYSGGFWGRKREVLAELSLEIACGEVFGLLGHNGAGKTTTMRLILGLLKPDSGSIRLFGEAPRRRRSSIWASFFVSNAPSSPNARPTC